jgi:hypothetical protein
MHNWLSIDDFCELVRLDKHTVEDMIERGKLTTKDEDGVIFIEATKGAYEVMPKDVGSEVVEADSDKTVLLGKDFIEKTIGTIMNLHKEVLVSKDETLEALKSENEFLKEALFSMQELYDEDRKTVDTLTKQLKHAQEELEFVRRKYKLMWNKAIENYSTIKE